jgi:hypothetical protein
VVANLTTLGARRLFRQSPAEFADLNLDLRLVLPPSRVDAIEERLAEAPSGAARIALVESFLVDCLQEAPGDRLVARAVELMQVDCWYRPVGELARALEIGAECILMAKNAVEGVLDADPREVPDARLIPRISHMEAIERGLRVMDTTALTLCMDNGLPIHVFNMGDERNIGRLLDGERVGTVVVTD